MIRVNDRQDPQQGSQSVPGAELVDDSSPYQRVFTVPQGEFVARLAAAGAVQDRFLVAIGNPDAPEGEAPDVWFGVVASWQPQGSKVRVTARAARTAEEAVHP
ncbi:hypothetical protein [Nocardia sp. Marseille-Q1738]